MDPITQPSATSEPVVTPTPIPVAEPTPQQSNRQAVYQKYYEASTPPSLEAPPTQAPEPVEPTPSAPVEPVVTPQPTDPRVEALQREIDGLKARLAPPPPVAPPPAEPVPDNWAAQWFELMKQGRVDEAMTLQEEKLTAKIRAQVEAEAVQHASQKAVEQMRVEQQIDRFVGEVRTSNPDLVELEDYISVRAEARLQQAQAAGKIKSAEDFVNEYKAAVNAEVEHTRNLVQRIRGAGKQEALTTRETVLSATPLTPQSVTSNREPTPPRAPETAQSYIAKRQERQWALRGIPPPSA